VDFRQPARKARQVDAGVLTNDPGTLTGIVKQQPDPLGLDRPP
jgi:hypothetical protein